MSFREPLLLAGLVLVPLAIAAYLVAQRRRRRYAVRYPAVDVLAGVAGHARGRHVPALLAVLSLAALGIALARPERTVAVEQRQGTVMLVHDTSGSMQATDVAPDRLSARARGRAHARQLAARGVPARRGPASTRASSRCPSRRPTAPGAARARRPEGAGRDGDGRRPAARDRRDPRAGDRRRRAAAAAAGRDRAAVGRREHEAARTRAASRRPPSATRSRSTRSRSGPRTGSCASRTAR